MRPVGVVRSALKDPSLAPRQGALAGTEAEIEIYPAYAEALAGVAGRALPAGEEAPQGSPLRKSGRIVVLCWMDRADRSALTVHPGGDPANPPRGVFATRSPHRPNPVSLHTGELLEVRGTVLRVRGMDAVDGTPVLDVKPYIPAFDRMEDIKLPSWVGHVMEGYF